MTQARALNPQQTDLSEFAGPAIQIAARPDGTLTVTMANAAFLADTGFDMAMLMHAPLPGPLGPGCEVLLDLARRVLADGRPADGIIGLVTPKGPRRHHMVLMPPSTGEAAACDRVLVLSTDITTDEALRYLDDALVTIKNVLWSLLVDAPVFNYVSRSVETLLGINAEELMTVPWTWHRYVHPDDLDLLQSAWKATQNGAIFDIEYRMLHPDGRTILIRDRGALVRDAQGRPLRIDGISQDVTAMRAAEAKAKAAEGLYRTVVENQVELICRFMPDLTIVFCNETYAALYGKSVTEITGRSLRDFLSPGEIDDVRQVIARLLAGEAVLQEERYKVLPEGRTAWYNWSDVAIYDDAGRIVEIQSIGRNVTARHEMERDLQASEQRLRLAIDSIPDAFALYDAADRLVLCNKQFYDLAVSPTTLHPIGRTFEELARESSSGPVAPIEAKDDPEGWVRRRLELHRNPPPHPTEMPLQNGRWLRISERRTADGGWVATWSDITPLKEAETRLGSAIAAFNEGFVYYDKNERLILCNERFKEFYPRSAPAMIPGSTLEEIFRYGMTHGEFAGVGDDPEAWLQMELARARNKNRSMFERELHDGRWLLVSRSPLPDGGLVSIIADLTQVKTREAELKQAQHKLQHQTHNLTQLAEQLRTARIAAESASQAKSRFLAHMSHELRTPLNAILGFADVIRNNMFGEISPARYRDYVQYIHDSGSHLLDMINDVLDLSKIEAGKFELKPQALDAEAIAQAGSKLVAGMAKENGVRLMIDIDQQCPVLHGDLRAVKQIIINLLSNSVKFTPSGGYVTLQIQRVADAGCEIIITDTGIGMGPDDIAKAMDPFGQIDGTLARKHRGTGLGLPLVKNLAEMQGGSLTIDSAPSRGTRVTVFLPLLPSLSAETADVIDA